MIFYQGLLPAKIWDPVKEKIVVDFNVGDGSIKTSDEEIIKLLKQKGYPTTEDMFELERTGKLPHGGFENIGKEKLPSKRPAIEQPGQGPTAAQMHQANKVVENAEKRVSNLNATVKKRPKKKSSNDAEIVIKRKRKKK